MRTDLKFILLCERSVFEVLMYMFVLKFLGTNLNYTNSFCQTEISIFTRSIGTELFLHDLQKALLNMS